MSRSVMNTLDTHSENVPITVVGLNHVSAAVCLREKAAFNDAQQATIFRQLSTEYNARGAIILSTCNRTEIYLSGRKAAKYIDDVCHWLDSLIRARIFTNPETVYIYKGRQAVTQFFRVIAGLDSQIVGEPQITGQVKNAYERSRRINCTDLLLNKMYHAGMQAEKKVRNQTFLGEGAVSVSFAAVELARKIFTGLEKRTVLLIGAGETAQLAACHFFKQGITRMIILNRTGEKARKLAQRFAGRALPLQKLPQALLQADIVLAATSSDNFILDKSCLEELARKRNYRPLSLIDLAMPRDIDPAVRDIDGIFLYDLDDLQEVVEANLQQRRKEIPRAETIINGCVDDFLNWYGSLPVVQTITQLSGYLEEIRQKEFNRLKNRFPKEYRAEAEYLSRSLMKKFLHHHIVTLRNNTNDPLRQKLHMELVDEIYKLNGCEKKEK